MTENNEEDDDIDMDVGTQREKEQENTSNKSKKRKTNNDDLIEVLKLKILRENQQQAEETNEDRLFLLSLVSELEKVPADRKLQLKANILNCISQAQGIQQPQPVPVFNPRYQPLSSEFQQQSFHEQGPSYWPIQSTSSHGNEHIQCPAPTPSPTFSDTSSLISLE